MNCKRGSMALVITSQAGNEGRVVTCLEYIGHTKVVAEDGMSYALGDSPNGWWKIDRKMNLILELHTGEKLMKPDSSPYCRDDYMMPIGDAGSARTAETEKCETN